MIGTIFTALGGASLVTKLIAGAALLAALGITYGVWHHRVYMGGYNDALAAIAKQDDKAIKAASSMRNAFLDCRARGLRWDQSSGECLGR